MEDVSICLIERGCAITCHEGHRGSVLCIRYMYSGVKQILASKICFAARLMHTNSRVFHLVRCWLYGLPTHNIVCMLEIYSIEYTYFEHDSRQYQARQSEV